jgi:hypothetical protein
MVMVYYLIYENTTPIRLSSDDVVKITKAFPNAPIITSDEVAEYFATKRTEMIYG